MVRGEVVLEKIAESITNDPDATILDAQVRTKCLRCTNYRYELWSSDHSYGPGTITIVPGTITFGKLWQPYKSRHMVARIVKRVDIHPSGEATNFRLNITTLGNLEVVSKLLQCKRFEYDKLHTNGQY